MPITLREALALPSLAHGAPEVLAGAQGLDRPLRWVHVTDLLHVGELLTGDELVLTTGIAMAASPAAATLVVDELVKVGAAGLVVELGPRYPRVADAAVAMARRSGLPLVSLRRPVRFVEVTEEVHRVIVADQFAQVRFARDLHVTFSELSMSRAPAGEIVRAAAELAGAPVLLEDQRRRVLAFAGAGGAELLSDWERRSRLAPVLPATGTTGEEQWTTTPVGPQNGVWGRLVLAGGTPGDERLPMVLERAAQALELERMVRRDGTALQVRAQGDFLHALLEGRTGGAADTLARMRSLGVTAGSGYVGIVLRHRQEASDDLATQRRLQQLTEDVTAALRTVDASGLVGVLDADRVAVVLSLPRGARADRVLAGLAAGVLARDGDVCIGAGPTSSDLPGVAASVRSARVVADVVVTMPGDARPYYRHSDVRLRGLLIAIRDDPRVQDFAESELGPLLEHEARHGGGLLELLRQFLAAGGNKAELARLTHRNRSALYPRLLRLQKVLGHSLDDPMSQLSLGVALLVHDQTGSPIRREKY